MNKTLKKILIKTKKQVFSEIIGNNSSLLKGEGYDFLELKEYEYGEDVKNIDWIISAKFKKPYVKVFHAQKELNINIVPILNGSAYFGTKKFKQELIGEICSLLAYSCIKQQDPFASFIANSSLELCTKKSKKDFAVHQMTKSLLEYNCLGKITDYKKISEELFRFIKKKSIIFLVGDFFDIENLDLRLLSRKHEVIAIITRDKFEEKPFELGNVNLIDPSTKQTFDGNIDSSILKKYEKSVQKNDHKLYEHLQSCNISFCKIYTHEEPLSKLLRLMR
ncbi:MAG: DUF58 domain-containing protein [Halarcobacter sp.]